MKEIQKEVEASTSGEKENTIAPPSPETPESTQPDQEEDEAE